VAYMSCRSIMKYALKSCKADGTDNIAPELTKKRKNFETETV